MKAAIMTFVIGEQYQKMYDAVFRDSVEKYCAKYGIDLKLITEPIVPFTNKQNLLCQKLIALSQEWAKEYDAIAWVESDILISPHAPNIFDEVTDDKVLFVNDHNYMDAWYMKQWHDDRKIGYSSMTEYIRNAGGIPDAQEIELGVNEGVTVFQPKYHAEYLKNLYDSRDWSLQPGQVGRDGTVLASGEIWWWYSVIKDGMSRHIDNRWNAQWCYYKRLHAEPYMHDEELIVHAKNYIRMSYFCHIPDRQNVGIIDFVYRAYYKTMNQILVVECGPIDTLAWLLHPLVRLKDFKTIYIVCTDDSAKNFLFAHFPRMQNMNFAPSNLYTFVNKVPETYDYRVPSNVSLQAFIDMIRM